MFMNTSTMLPMNMLAMTPQAISGRISNSIGPGCTPSIISAPSMTAVVPELGMPIASIGMMEAVADALFAASGAATPTMSPLPKFSGFLLSCRSVV